MLYANGVYWFEEFVYETGRVQTLDRLFEVFKHAMLQLGFDRVNFSILSDSELDMSALGFGLISTYPEDWQTHYLQNDLSRIDPVVKWATGTNRPFRWKDIERRTNLSRRQTAFLREGEAAGLYNGVGVPFSGPAFQVGGIALATSLPSAHQLSNLDLLAAYVNHFYAIYKRLVLGDRRNTPAGVKLTDREREVLIRVAHGRLNHEIAEALSVSVDTVEYHLKNIYAKLHANNKASAVAIGLTSGLFRF